ncbi:MAG: hypothetical protein F6K53_37160, partial [Moorea sp. SIO4A1]|uniref:hypothetical protein n=1 Tax=Moorena sp. SIO4A1 TaxID=2607835 RepID=UPI00144CC45F
SYGDIPICLGTNISQGTSLGLNILLEEGEELTPGPKISQGTCIGLKKLEEMESSDNQTVLEFLGNKVRESSQEIEIIFAGRVHLNACN